MKKSNRRTKKSEGKGDTSTLALTRSEMERKPDEAEIQFNDRVIASAYWKLQGNSDRSDAQELELKNVKEKFIASKIAEGGYMAAIFTDSDMMLTIHRLHDDLSAALGDITPVQKLLLDRLLIAVSDGIRYERMFMLAKYQVNDKEIATFNDTPNRVQFLKEIRKGKESVDERMMRYAQALFGQSIPPVYVKTVNAFFGQNQQINQSPPKDLEKNPEPPNEKPHS